MKHTCFFIILLVFIVFIKPLFADSLTISPFSFTLHSFHDPVIEKNFKNNPFHGATTLHYGINIIYKQEYMQYGAWYFSDSFDNPAGGLILGPKYDFNKYFSLGVAGGIYVRQTPCFEGGSENCADPLPLSARTGGIDIAPLIGLTPSITVPINHKFGIETNCLVNGLINNCQMGLKFSF